MEKLRDNKIIKILLGIIRFALYAIFICTIFVIIIQRVSDNSLSLGGIRIFNVLSGSMAPDFDKGDILVVKQVDTDILTVGQDIAYKGKEGQVEGKIITHRIIDIENKDGKKVFHTKGISNMIEDPEVQADQIYGVVVYKMIIISWLNKLMYNIYIFYFVLIVPTGIIIFLEIKNIHERLKEDE